MTKTLNARLRPLQRRLQEEGATSRALPGGGVRGVGVGRLAGTDGLLTEIAARFGFSDSPLFSRAFKRGTERLRTGFAVSPGRTAAASPDGGDGRSSGNHRRFRDGGEQSMPAVFMYT
ncbi:putative transcriptional regulator [Burkholderia pseudomallei MSHR4375]|nr:AraC family transcriptional regulator [Burkholderia pseudomallei]KGV79076.1 putative transcriptional regulator [Burkholderia pseudomallei MSHR4375]VBS71333.1 putative transcriptional regulator [Burkholderia pseudomallei]